MRKEWAAGRDPLREGIGELKKLKTDTQSLLEQSNQVIESSLQRIREEARAIFDQARQEVTSIFQLMKEEEGRSSGSEQEIKKDIDGLKRGMERFEDQIGQVAKGVLSLNEVIKEGVAGLKEELGSLMKFSYADLEKKISALEARIKALEKLVFH